MTKRNARFQEWAALLTNRSKRQRSGEFVVQGVRPITLAVREGWPVTALLYDERRSMSRWARDILDQEPTVRVAMAPELLHELGGKADEAPELVAIVRRPDDDLGRIPLSSQFLGIVFDRPVSPGNIGMLVRSADAFGASGVIVTGHAADVYDPKSIRASTGSLFAIPVVRSSSHREVLDWLAVVRRELGTRIEIVGMDEAGGTDVADHDFTQPVIVVVGHESHGLSAGWREACDATVRIPMVGAASSLNAAASATVALYESARQRAVRPGRG